MNDAQSSASSKGKALEKAVRFIQETILHSDPRLRGVKFSIESNVIVNVQGVHHEIDVLVKTLPDSPFETKWIFECKNWKEPVGKNEIIILSEKVDAVVANGGCMVAPALTFDAKAQLAKDLRLKFVASKEDFLSPLTNLEVIHTAHHPLPVTIRLRRRGYEAISNPPSMPWEGKPCWIVEGGTKIEWFPDLSWLAAKILDEVVRLDSKDNMRKYQLEGIHWAKQTQQMIPEGDELYLDGDVVDYLEIDLAFLVVVQKRKIVSQFELEGQGQVFFFEPIDSKYTGQRIEVRVVNRF